MTKYIYNPFTNNLDAVAVANPAGSGLDFLTGNSGGQVGADAGNNIFLVGDNATGITVIGSPGTNTLTITGLPSSTIQVGTTRYATNAEAAGQALTTAALTPSNITSFFSISPLPPSQGGALSLIGTTNQIDVTLSPSTATFSLTNGISLGSFQLSAPPVGGMLIPGQVVIGTSTIDLRPGLMVNTTTPYGIWCLGTRASVDSSDNQIGIFSRSTFAPTLGSTGSFEVLANPSINVPAGETIDVAAGYFGDVVFPANLGTVTDAAVFLSGVGFPGTGTIVNSYGGYFSTPLAGTNRIALYADDLTIGSPGVVPPINGARILGMIRNDALTAFTTVAADGNKNLVSIPNNTSGFVLTSNGAGAIPTFQAITPVGFIVGTANQIDIVTSLGTSTVSLTDGISLGSFQATAPPVGGMLIPGEVSIGSASPDTNSNLYITGTSANGIRCLGHRTSVDSNFIQSILGCEGSFAPTGGSVASVQIGANALFSVPVGQTTTLAAGVFAQNNFTLNAGTVTISANFYSGGGDVGAGTIGDSYGGYFNTPLAGTNKIAFYTDGLTVGSPGVVPPANGARILGAIRNDALTPFETMATDASSNLTTIASNTAGFLLTSNGAGATPTFQIAPPGSLQGAARYVVTPNLSQGGGYTSVQDAIDQAVADGADSGDPATVWIWPGTYTENLTLAPFVHLAAANSGAVQISGNASYTPTTTGDMLCLHDITFITLVSGDAFSAAGSVVNSVDFYNCNLTGTAGNALTVNNTNGTVNLFNSKITAESGHKCFNLTNCINIIVVSCFTINVDTESTIASGTLSFFGCFTNDNYILTGNSGIFFIGSYTRGTPPTVLFDIGASARVELYDCVVYGLSTSNYWATGTGSLAYNNISLGNHTTTVRIDPALTLTRKQTQIIELQSSPSNSNTVTAAFVTSLTAGTAVQNTTGYDILVNVCVSVTSSTTATIVLGVGNTSTPTTNTVIPSFTLALAEKYTFSAYVPAFYYLLVDTTGTIVVASITTQAMGI